MSKLFRSSLDGSPLPRIHVCENAGLFKQVLVVKDCYRQCKIVTVASDSKTPTGHHHKSRR